MNICSLSHIWKDNVSQNVMVFRDLMWQFCSSIEVLCAGNWMVSSMGLSLVRPCIISLRLLRDFKQSNSCFAHAVIHNSNFTESPTYIAVLWPAFLFHASPVCPLVLCCNSGCYFQFLSFLSHPLWYSVPDVQVLFHCLGSLPCYINVLFVPESGVTFM